MFDVIKKVFGTKHERDVKKYQHIIDEINDNYQSYHQLTNDEEFWKGCSSCKNYDILLRNQKTMCLCTAMLAPAKSNKSIKAMGQPSSESKTDK